MRALIIDVDSDVQRRLSLELLQIHVHADCVSNANDAIERLGQRAYAFVLLDTALPGGGSGARRRCRRRSGRSSSSRP